MVKVAKLGFGGIVISTKWAAKYLNISYKLLSTNIDKEGNRGRIRYQARVDDEDGSRPILGFDVSYLKEVKKILGSVRKQGMALFTEDVEEQLQKLNKKWEKDVSVL